MRNSHRLFIYSIFLFCLGACSLCRAAEFKGKVFAVDGSLAKGVDIYLVLQREDINIDELSSTKSADDGSFHFDKTAGGPQTQVLAISNNGAMFSYVSPGQSIDLHLRPGIELTASIVDAQNKPVTNVVARIGQLLIQESNYGFFFLILPAGAATPWTGKTDANGSVTFRNLPQGSSAQLVVEDDRYAALTYHDRITLPRKDSLHADPIKLQSAASLSGKVTFGPSGKPVAGLHIGAQSDTAGGGDAITAADGSYHMHRLGPGKYNVALDIKGDLAKSWTARAIEGLSLNEGQIRTDGDFTLIEGAVLQGHVVANDNGEAIPGVPIGVYGPAHPRSGAWVQVASSAADGSFSFRVPGGEQYIYIQTSQPPKGFAMPSPTDQTIVVEDGKTATVDFKMPRGPVPTVVKGRAVDSDGHPIAGATINVFSNDRTFGGEGSATSAADGTFQVDEPPARDSIRLRARKDDLATRAGTTVKAGQKDEVVLKLEKNALASATGRIVDDKGQPVLPGAEISLSEMFGNYGFSRSLEAPNSDGTFAIDELFADGAYTVYASAKGYSHTLPIRLKLKAGQTVAQPDIILRKRDAHIAGVLLDDDGNPVPNEKVYITGKQTGSDSITTDKDGKFQEDVVAGDQLSVYYRPKTGPYITKPVKAGDEHIVIDPMAAATNK